MNPLRRRSCADRRGISLLEVMISIGVVGIGLIGVAALIPLAHYKAAQGIRQDRKALTGRRAFREFRIRDFDRPGDMSNPDAPDPYWYSTGGNAYAEIYAMGGDGKLIRQSYCLDPLFVAAALSGGSSGSSTTFPNNSPIWIPRVTLLSARPDDLRRRMKPGDVRSLLLGNNPPFMNLSQAEEIFLLRDELVFDQPEDATQPPFQRYLENNKRYATGSYSWMATLTPDPVTTSDRYTLSVVVFHRRNLVTDPSQEIIAESQFLGSNLADVKEVFVRQNQPPTNKEASVQEIKNGDWIALMQQLVAGNPRSFILKWYRVLAADELDGDGDINRELSLSGPDWTVRSPEPVYAVYVRNVIAVYEKTIRLHDSSMYAY